MSVALLVSATDCARIGEADALLFAVAETEARTGDASTYGDGARGDAAETAAEAAGATAAAGATVAATGAAEAEDST